MNLNFLSLLMRMKSLALSKVVKIKEWIWQEEHLKPMILLSYLKRSMSKLSRIPRDQAQKRN